MADRDLILAVNAGSSSLKISVFNRRGPDCVLTAAIGSISSPPASFSFDGRDEKVESITDHASGFAHFLERLQDAAGIARERVRYVCHRVVHGGDYLEPVEITPAAYEHIEHLSDLAPLHNGAALSVITACIHALPDATSIAYFDTAFHRSIPIHVSTYAINPAIASERGLHKYGFHGLSYAFVLRAVSGFLDKPSDSLNLIVLHLGSGASACAIKRGKSLDTSMGLTPLMGLPGATRSGSVDPSLIFHYTNTAGKITHDKAHAIHFGVTEAEDILNRKSGWKALTGTTDFGEITRKAELDDENPEVAHRNPYRLAFDVMMDRVLHYIGAYHLGLGGDVDALVFTGGIGERGVQLRSMIGKKIACLGYRTVDEAKNASTVGKGPGGTVVDISEEREGGKGRVLVVQTDEQFEMARQCSVNDNLWK